MARYRLIIKPLSPFQTPLQSDTIFGHICWALRYIKGEGELKRFLNSFTPSDAPLILSSGFPKDYLPMPVLRPFSIEEEDMLWDIYNKAGKQKRLDFTRDLKALKNVRYIEVSALYSLSDKLSYYSLYEKHFMGDILLEDRDISKSIETWHNAKNRLTDRVMEGKLFVKEDTFYQENVELTVYIEGLYFDRKALCDIFDFISLSGYGADKSSGRGKFAYDILDGWDLPEVDHPNAFLTLSHFHPRQGDFTKGFYEISTKFGKIGGHWAAGIDGGPHKVPLLMLSPGSVFKTDYHRPFYGGLITDVHKQQGIVHYGIALPLMVRIV